MDIRITDTFQLPGAKGILNKANNGISIKNEFITINRKSSLVTEHKIIITKEGD
jgi:hypothetical protein